MNDATNNTENLSRREREKAQHRQEILDAAVKVFAEKGFHAATLDEIAQEAEFSKAALYLYFSNKEDLLYNILNDAFEKWYSFSQKILHGKDTFRNGLNALFNNVAEEILTNPEMFSLISAQHAALFNALSEKSRIEFMRKHDETWKLIEKRVTKAIGKGELRDISPKAVLGLIHGSLDGMVCNQWCCKTLDELKNAILVFMDILFNGIAKKKEA